MPLFFLSKGLMFEFLKSFKNVLQAWSIAEHFSYRITYSNRTCVMAKCCTDLQCLFYIRCNHCFYDNSAILTTLEPNHTCQRHVLALCLVVSQLLWLVVKVPKLLTVDCQTSTTAIIDAV